MEQQAGQENFKKRLNIALLLMIIFFLILQFVAIFFFNFHWNERENIHVAYLISQGKLPYVDFFSMHMPLHNMFISLFMFIDPILLIFLMRFISLLAFIGILIIVYKITIKYSKNKNIALAACLFLVGFRQIFVYSFRIVPDNFSALFLFLGFFLYVFLALNESKRKSLYNFFIGIFFSISLLFQLKSIFFIVPIILLMIFRKKFKIVPIIIGALIPLILFFGYFKFSIENLKILYLLNFRFNTDFLGISQKTVLFSLSTYIVVNFILVLSFFLSLFDKEHLKKYWEFGILCLFAIGFYAFFAIKGFIGPQYFIYFIPFIAMFAAPKLVKMFMNLKIRTLIVIILVIFGFLIPVLAFAYDFNKLGILSNDLKEMKYFLENKKPAAKAFDDGWLIYHDDVSYEWIFIPNAPTLVKMGLIKEYNITKILEGKPQFVKDYEKVITNPEDIRLLNKYYTKTDFSDLYILKE